MRILVPGDELTTEFIEERIMEATAIDEQPKWQLCPSSLTRQEGIIQRKRPKEDRKRAREVAEKIQILLLLKETL